MQFRRKTCLLLFLRIVFIAHGQCVSNLGLNSPQKPETFPQSKVPIKQSEKKPKVKPVSEFKQENSCDFLITSGWELAEASKVVSNPYSIFSNSFTTANWYNATVHGTVLTTLVDQGIYLDPSFGINNLEIPDSICHMDWWYRISFYITKNQAEKIKWLQFDGINYRAEIWLNSKQIGKINGAFIRGEVNISNYVNLENENILAVYIFPPPNPGIPHEESPRAGTGPNGGHLCLDGPTFISSEGWDWMPGIRDRNIGIWQPVHLYFTGNIKIYDTHIVTSLPYLPDTTVACLLTSYRSCQQFYENQTGKI
jgi:hypothetical protein